MLKMDAKLLVLTLAAAGAASAGAVTFGSTATPERTELRQAVAISDEEHASTIRALKPPKRARPVIAVIADNDGAETTDFLVPYGILQRSGVADVTTVAPQLGMVHLGPALAVRVQSSLAGFDRRYPDGADYVIVPALSGRNERILKWINAQVAKGAIIVGVCSGVQTLSHAGLLADRSATGYWGDIDRLRAQTPTMKWVQDRRYVVDRGVVTTTGVTASVPVSLALVEAIAGTEKAARLASSIGVRSWRADHDTAAFRVEGADAWKFALTTLMPVGSTSFGIPVRDGVDDIALAFMSDAYSRVYRNRVAVLAPSASVWTAGGLEVITDQRQQDAEVDEVLASPPARLPARALDSALEDIGRRFGLETAGRIAHQLEYPRREL